MAFLSKYGEARTIQIPIIKRGVVDFAVSADWTPAAGDVKITKDGGAAANVTNLPTALTMGNGAIWVFSLTATEMQAARIEVTVIDAATKAVEDTAFAIETYGNASAQHAFDLDTATPGVNVTQFGGTNGTFAAGRPEVNVSHWLGTAAATPTVAGVPEVDVTHWLGTAAATPTVAGVPEVDITHFGGTAGTFASGRPEVNTTHAAGTAWNSGSIGAATFAAGAIDAAAIAANAIGASELAADAATEIADAVWASVTRTLTAATNITSTGGTITLTSGGVHLADGAHGGTATVVTFERMIGASTTTNEPCIKATGNGSAAGIHGVGGSSGGSGIRGQGSGTGGKGIHGSGGSGVSSHGIYGQGGSTSGGAGIYGLGTGTSGNAGIVGEGNVAQPGIYGIGGSSGGAGIHGSGSATGAGIKGHGGIDGPGIHAEGGATSGDGMLLTRGVTTADDLKLTNSDAPTLATVIWAGATRTLTGLGFTLAASDLAADCITAAKVASDVGAEFAAAWGSSIIGNGRTRDYFLQGGANKVEFAADGLTFTVYSTDDLTTLYTGTSTRLATTVGGLRSIDPT